MTASASRPSSPGPPGVMSVEGILGFWTGLCPSSWHTLGGSSAVTYLGWTALTREAGITSGCWTEASEDSAQAGQKATETGHRASREPRRFTRSRLWVAGHGGPHPPLNEGSGSASYPHKQGDPDSRESTACELQRWRCRLGSPHSQGKGLRPHQPLCVPSGGQEPCRLCRQQRLEEICLDGSGPGRSTQRAGWACL